MLSYEHVISLCKEDHQWKDFMDDEEGRLFHKKCQSCNFVCDNRVLKYSKFNEDQCKKKQERTKENKEDEISDNLLERIEGKLSGSPKKSIK